jgi:hypothetical protein
MPKIKKAFNEAVDDPNGDNTFGQVIKQLMNQDGATTSPAGNILANLMESNQAPSSVMERVQADIDPGLTAEEVAARLRKLDRIEKARNSRKGKR